jgi:class 3 adenylate cyclase/energy-coupling factor transporter ATP-binding protein EcfA2
VTLSAALRQVCAGCAGVVDVEADRCPGCGTPRAEATRRVVTLLFADLAGYTALCQSLDPEEVHLLIRPLMNALRAICEDAGGIVPSIEGDGFMAVFGAVVARENDPVMGLHAASRMQQLVRERATRLPQLPSLHLGLHVGEVVVAPSWEQVGISLSGDPVNVASRLCGNAEGGEVLVSEAVVALSGVTDGWGPPRQVQLRGRDRPVEVRTFAWERRDEVVPAQRWASHSTYVARPAIEDVLQVALDTGRGAVVLGEAGAGKSRLLRHLLGARPHRLVVCSPTRMMLARDVLVEVLRGVDDVPAGLFARLVRGPADDEGEDAERALVRAAARHLDEDVLVVVEDAERLEEPEAALLAEAVSAGGTWFFASRRELPVGLPAVGVPPLSEPEAAAFVEALLPGASQQLTDVLLNRAGDSPLFLEQCAQFLVESGVVTVGVGSTEVLRPDELRGVPTSMRLFVSGRLDLLQPVERDVLGMAAALGDAADPDLLTHLAGDVSDVVDALVDRRLLRWRSGTADRPVLAFSHALVRDVAYDTQLRQRRSEIHRAAADWYAVLPTVHVLEAQAFHLEQAVALGESDCGLLRRAVEAMVHFARSVELERSRAARSVLDRARALAESRPECAPDLLQLEISSTVVAELAGDHASALRSAARGLDLALERREALAEAELRVLRAKTLLSSDPGRASDELDLAGALYRAAEDLAGEARVAVERGWVLAVTDGVPASLPDLERGFHLSMRSGDARLQAQTAQQLALHHAIVSGTSAYEQWAARARAVSRADDDGLEMRLSLSVAALASFGLDVGTGLAQSHVALSGGRELGLAHVYENALIIRLDLLVIDGRLTEAAELLGEGRRAAAARLSPVTTIDLDLIEARLRQRQGDLGAAERLLAGVQAHPYLATSHTSVRDLAEARAWSLLERGLFAEAAQEAATAVAMDTEADESLTSLRPRMAEVVARTAARLPLRLNAIASLRATARSTGLALPAGLASRWVLVDELTRGWDVDLFGIEEADGLVEGEALDLEISALSTRTWSLLVEAAQTWRRLGDTVWEARALLWHSELTGQEHPEADALLLRLRSPDGLAAMFRGQVSALGS